MIDLQANNVVLPQNQTMEHFNQGATTAESVQNSEFERARQGMELLAGAAFGVLNNDLDGKADPQQWEQTLDYFEQRGLPVQNWRGKPQLANTLARSSLNVLGTAQNQEQLEQGWARLEQDIAQAANGANETYYAPIAGTVDGKPVYVQPGNRGSSNVMETPEGFTPQSRFEKVDLGTEWLVTDTTTGVQTRYPKNNEQAAFESAFGSAAGKAAAERIDALPGLLAQADNMMTTIDGILNDPALDSSTGWLAWMQQVPGTDAYRFGQRALQLQGQAFLQAFESLRGGGQITQIEGEKATQAIGRLSTAQSPEDYRDALNELKDIINAAKSRATNRASVTPDNRGGAPDPALPVPGTPGTPGSGDVVDFTDYFD